MKSVICGALCTLAFGLAAVGGSIAEVAEADYCNYRNACTGRNAASTTSPQTNLDDQIRVTRSKTKQVAGALRHRIEVDCTNNNELKQFLRSVVQDGGQGFAVDEKQSVLLTATFKWDTQKGTENPIVFPVFSFTKDAAGNVEEITCAAPPIFSYINPDVDVYVTLNLKRTRDASMNPAFVSSVQTFVSAIGLFAGIATGGTSLLITFAGNAAKSMKDNEKNYDLFVNRLDNLRDIKTTERLAKNQVDVNFNFPEGGVIRFKRTAIESPLFVRLNGKLRQTEQDIPSQLAEFYKMDYNAIFARVPNAAGEQLRGDIKTFTWGCDAIQQAVAETPGLLPDERVIILVHYLRRFDGANPPKFSCIKRDQAAVLKKYAVKEPYVALGAPEPAPAKPTLPERNGWATAFFYGLKEAQRTKAIEDIKDMLWDRVSLRREASLVSFPDDPIANDEAAAKLLLNGPEILRFGCYRKAKPEVEKAGYHNEILVSYSGPTGPTLANVLVGFAPGSENEVNALYFEPVAESIKKSILEVFKGGCYSWKPFS